MGKKILIARGASYHAKRRLTDYLMIFFLQKELHKLPLFLFLVLLFCFPVFQFYFFLALETCFQKTFFLLSKNRSKFPKLRSFRFFSLPLILRISFSKFVTNFHFLYSSTEEKHFQFRFFFFFFWLLKNMKLFSSTAISHLQVSFLYQWRYSFCSSKTFFVLNLYIPL